MSLALALGGGVLGLGRKWHGLPISRLRVLYGKLMELRGYDMDPPRSSRPWVSYGKLIELHGNTLTMARSPYKSSKSVSGVKAF